MASTIGRAVIEFVAEIATFTGDVGKAAVVFDKNMRGMQRSVQNLQNAFTAVLVGTGVTQLAREMVDAATQAETASNRLNAVIRANGVAAGVSRERIEGMVESLTTMSTFDGTAVRNASAELVKFGNISGPVFEGALKASADLAAFMGTDLPAAAQIVGKSLQSPTEGLTAMEKQFGKLTEAQENNIKSLVAQGRALDAQNAVLDLWRQKIGGVAQEMNTGFLQATKDVGKAFGDMWEAIADTKAGGLVKDMLGGIRDILRDIEKLAKPRDASMDPLRQLAAANEQLTTLERTLQERRNQRRAYGGGDGVDDVSDAKIVARIAELRALANSTLAKKNAVEREMALEAARTNFSGPITLGGKTTEDPAKAMQEAVFRAEKAVELQEIAATDTREAWEAYTKSRLEQEAKVRAATEEGRQAWFKSIDMEQERAIEAGEAFLDAERARRDALKETDKAAQDLGLTFTSAFEDAVLEGKELRDVVQGLGKDIARMALRFSVTQPLGNAMGDLFKDILRGGGDTPAPDLDFAGVYADGGFIGAGKWGIAGEEGPEPVFGGATGATVFPNDSLRGGGGPVIGTIDMRGASVEAVARLEMLLARLGASIAPTAANVYRQMSMRGA